MYMRRKDGVVMLWSLKKREWTKSAAFNNQGTPGLFGMLVVARVTIKHKVYGTESCIIEKV